ncbi:MAG: hypothetical protein IH597_07785 [Bacteroidales bacterium]|nr:hypothetical protein [Bacteroidales bacterium]
MPETAKEKLTVFGGLLELETSGITYPAISGHPDIFFCQTPAGLIVAPNLPEEYFSLPDQYKIIYKKGEKAVGKTYPHTAPYNAVVTSEYIIHNLKYTDPILLEACEGLTPIHVNQAYTRCNLLALNENLFITSDKGICNSLLDHGLNCHYFPPDEIRLEGFPNGFLGGACGIWDQKLFICGSLRHHSWGNEFRKIVEAEGFEIIELVDGTLTDVGSIFFE